MIRQPERIQKQFRRMGADVSLRIVGAVPGRRENRPSDHRINVQNDLFVLNVADNVNVNIVEVDPDKRHLLLHVGGANVRRYLCGHDERHWFVAGVDTKASTIEHAMRLLQPPAVQEAVKAAGLKGDEQFKRKNKAYVRQGEWFFVPRPSLFVHDRYVLKHEPIQRGRSKPHICQHLYRTGGTRVHVCQHYPNGLTQEQLELSWTEPLEGLRTPSGWFGNREHTQAICMARPRWMVRDAEVYVKGTVEHPDHETLHLRGWHRVHLSAEVQNEEMAFLD